LSGLIPAGKGCDCRSNRAEAITATARTGSRAAMPRHSAYRRFRIRHRRQRPLRLAIAARQGNARGDENRDYKEALRRTDLAEAGKLRLVAQVRAGKAPRQCGSFGRPAAYNGLELSCPAEAGRLAPLYATLAGRASRTDGPARRVSFSDLLCAPRIPARHAAADPRPPRAQTAAAALAPSPPPADGHAQPRAGETAGRTRHPGSSDERTAAQAQPASPRRAACAHFVSP
jgi:hypothetical protein